jgi:hypothetical protein
VKRYYYAGGKRVTIEEDDTRVAVDISRAGAAGLQKVIAGVSGPRLPGGVVVTERSALDKEGLERLRKAGALRPVFRHDRAVMVGMPEIRVEVDDETQRQAVLASIDRSPHPVEISEQGDDRLLLRPTSGSGDEALEVANFVYEQAHPAAASIRFVQFVPRPDTRR